MDGRHGNDRTPLHPSARSSARMGLGQVDVIAPGLIHCRLAGHVKAEHIQPVLDAGDEQIAAGFRVLLVIDADDVHAWKSEVRQIFQAWLVDNASCVEKAWVIYRSPIIKMGLRLMNAQTDGLVIGFDDPEAFDEAVDAATRRARAGHSKLSNNDSCEAQLRVDSQAHAGLRRLLGDRGLEQIGVRAS
ncbi:hypothetical protein ENSA5_55530 [Enhygromyxa salina]|uniref:Uncharacterized protein n=1 Tax=Enhygromyxa salina TaxID=215803 RepID=A0A2S9XEZ0_9BACT|nr:hypothetical protein [Enhygromyxa salina]PRP91436.1 hypothetical protein ENSA5_55530 [Enhygromyxa salina]